MGLMGSIVTVVGGIEPGFVSAGSDGLTHMYDVAGAPGQSLVVDGVTVSWDEGGAGAGVQHAGTGTDFTSDPTFTEMRTAGSSGIDGNSVANGLEDFIWVEVSFSEPVVVGQSFGMIDIDGAVNNWELGAIVGFNGGTPVAPTYASIGSALSQTSRTVINNPAGVTLPSPLQMVGATSLPGNVPFADPAGHFFADFGSALVDEVYLIFAISPTVVVNGVQTSGLFDIGFEQVLADNDPDATDDAESTPLDTPVNINWMVNDSTLASPTLDSFDSVATKGGSVTDAGGGVFTYTPPLGFVGVDTFNYTICDNDTPTPTCDTAMVTVLVGHAAPPGAFGTLLSGGAVNIAACGLDITMTITDETSNNVTYFAGDAFIDSGLHISNQFGAQVGGASSGIQLHFSKKITGFQVGLEAQQTEERISFSTAAVSAAPTTNSTYGVAPAVVSSVALINGGTSVQSNLTGMFGTDTSAAFGSDSTITIDAAVSPITSLSVSHSGPLDVGVNGLTVYNGTIVNDDFVVACTDAQIGVAKDVTSAAFDDATGTFTATYGYELENLGGQVLHDVQVSDDLTTRFGSFVAGTPTNAGEYTIVSTTITSNSSDPMVLAAFTGSAPATGFLDGDSGSLVVGETARIESTVQFFPAPGVGPQTVLNTAVAIGDTPANNDGTPDGDTGDNSTDGTNPDPNSNGEPEEEVPTPLTFETPPQRLVCSATGAFTIRDNNGKFVPLATDVSPFTFGATTATANDRAGALAYNIEDGQLYAVDRSSNDLLRVGADGTVINIGRPLHETSGTPLNDPPGRSYYDLAAADGDGNLYLGEYRSSNVTIVDVSEMTWKRVTLNASPRSSDWAINPVDGKLYAIRNSSRTLFVADPVTGVTETRTMTGSSIGTNGSAFFDAGGNYYTYATNGRLYRLADLAAGSEIELVSTGPFSSTRDGASCADGAYVSKTVSPSTAAAGDIVTYTFEIVWRGNDPAVGASFADTLTFPGTYVADTLTINGSATSTPLGGIASAYGGTNTFDLSGMTLGAESTNVFTIDVMIDPSATASEVENQALLSELGDDYDDVLSDYPETPLPGDPTPLTIVEPFVCQAYQAFTIQGGAGQLFSFDTDTTPYTYDAESAAGQRMNALSFNIQDGQMYAINNSDQLYRIGPDGTYTNLGSPKRDTNGANLPNIFWNGGTMDDQGNLWAIGSSQRTYVRINVNTLEFTQYLLPSNFLSGDLAWNPIDGKLYAIQFNSSTNLIVIDPLAETITYTPIGGVSAGNMGGTWMSPDGVLYGYDNAGRVIRVADPIAATPAEFVSTGPASSLNDSAGCASGPALTKDVAVSPVLPGGTVTYTFEVTWSLDEPISGVDLVDVLGFDATYVANSVTVNGTPTNAPLGGSAGDVVDGVNGAYADTNTFALYDMTLPAESTTTITIDVLIGATAAAGFVENQATLEDLGPRFSDVPSDYPGTPLPGDPTPLEILPQPLMELLKEQVGFTDNDGNGEISLGDAILYEFTATNTGNTLLTDVVITDTDVDSVDCGVFDGELDPAESATCTGSYVVQQADVDATEFVNTATVTGDPPPGGPPLPPVPPSTVTTPINQNPSIQLTKSNTSGTGPFAANDTITYEFEIVNTGDVALTNVTLLDAKVGFDPAAALSTLTCVPAQPDDTLAVGESATCSADYPVTQADIDGGQIANTAVAAGESPLSAVVDDTDDELVILQQSPQIEMVKDHASAPLIDADGSGTISPNDTIQYTFDITNSGNVTIDSLVVTDPLVGLSAIDCGGATSLAPGDTTQCTATYVVTPADSLAGQIDNTATVDGSSPSGAAVQDTDDDVVPVVSQPSIAVTKSLLAVNGGVPTGTFAADDVLTYLFVVTNTGGVPLTAVGVTDTVITGPITCALTTLAPGAFTTCTGDYTALQSDVNAGQIDNTATATGTPPTGPDVTADASHTAPTTQTPDIQLTKSVAGTPGPGATLTYNFIVLNTGNVTLTNIVLTDLLPGLSAIDCGGATAAAPGDGFTCTATYTVGLDDVNAGSVTNDASVTGDPPTGPPVTDDADVTVVIPQDPSIDVSKTNAITNDTAPAGVTADDEVTYTITITNDGDVTLTGVTYTDDLLQLAAVPITGAECTPAGGNTAPAGDLAPGDSVDCVLTYTVLQTDVDAGRIDNTATGTGVPPNGPPPVDTSTSTIIAAQNPGIQVTKVLASRADDDASGNDTVGDDLVYEVTIENTGTVTLDPVTVDDATIGVSSVAIDGAECGDADGALDPGDTVTCTFSYDLQQPEIDAGSLENTATGTGQPPAGLNPVTDDDTVVTTFQAAPEMTLVKTLPVVPDPIVDGTQLNFVFLVENTGNVTLTNLEVDDSLLGTISCVASLAPGVTDTCTAPYTVTQDDIDAGVVVNIATGTGQPPQGPPPPPTPPSEVVTPIPQDPQITIVKTATNTPTPAADQTIDYDFDVTNSGNVTVFDVVVTDPLIAGVTCPDTSAGLLVGDSVTCTGSYVTTQGDVDAGQVINTATANATPPPTSGPVPPTTDNETVPLTRTPDWSFVKSLLSNADEDGDTFVSLDDTLTYNFVVTNLGNVTIDNIVVDDPLVGPVGCPVTTLAPGESTTCSADYMVTQADVDNGEVVNSATVGGETPPGTPPPPLLPPSQVTTPVPTNPGITTLKQFVGSIDNDGDGIVSLDDTMQYEFVVTNTGDVTLDPISVTDARIPLITCPVNQLAPGETTTCTGEVRVAQGDVDAGEVLNSAFGTGTPPGGPPVDSPPSVVTTPVPQVPAIEVTKTIADNADGDGSGTITFDDVLTYTLSVENTGNVTLDPVTVTDALLGITDATCGVSALSPGQVTTCDFPYTVTQPDVDAALITNTATATGTPPSGPPIDDDDTVNTPIGQVSELSLDKTSTVTDNDGDGLTEPGDIVTYTFTASNIGNVTLTDVSITDPLVGLSALVCAPAQPTTLAPADVLSCAATYTITPADADAGQVANEATGNGTPPPGAPPLDPPTDDNLVPIDRVPSIDLTKEITTAPAEPGVGDTITYTFTIVNTGNVTLNPVTLDDAKLGLVGATCGASVLLAGATTTCTQDYVVGLADVDGGIIENSATATGTPPPGLPPVTDTDTLGQILAQNPSITLDKTVVNNDDVADGVLSENDTLTYTFDIENDGDVTLTVVTLTDALVGLGPITCVPSLPTDFAPGDTASCTADYTVTAGDAAAGEVVNDATVTGVPPIGPPVEANDTKIVTVDESPSISLTKSATVPVGDLAVDDVITYTFEVANTGNVSLDPVAVTDTTLPGLSAIDCGANTTLAIGASFSCSATYTVTQADLDSGTIDNTATATGTSPGGEIVTDEDDERVIPNQVPDITITKALGSNDDADGSGSVTTDDTLTYDFTLTNTGNVTLASVSYSDPTLGITNAVCDAVTTLAPGASTSCQATYQVTQADVDAGELLNTATGTGTPPVGPPVTTTDDETIIPGQVSDLDLVKSLDGFDDLDASTDITVDDILNFEFAATNNGSVTIFDITVDDPTAGTVTCPDTSGGVAPGDSITCTANYTVTQADVDNGSVVNTATATGNPPPGGPPVIPPTSTVTTPLDQTPGISVLKTNDAGPVVAEGDTITYSFVVTSTGNVTLDPVVVTDPLPGLSAITCDLSALDPAGVANCSATYQVTQADVDSGLLANTATATGTPPAGPPIDDDSTSNIPIPQAADIALVKTPSPATASAAGEVITYTFEATNTGNVTLNSVTVADPLPGLSALACDTTTLAPGEVATCTAIYTIAQADVDAGMVANTASVTGTTPSAVVVQDDATADVPVSSDPSINLDKAVSANADEDGSGTITVDDTLTYTFTLTNDGNISLDPVSLTDTKLGLVDVSCTAATLAPGESTSCDFLYVVTQADVDAGTIDNDATGSGQPPTGPPVTDDDTVSTPVTQTADSEIVKVAVHDDTDADGQIDPDETIDYTITFTNTGNVTLTDVTVTDTLIPVVCDPATPATLAPDESTSCTGTYTVTQADVDAGQVLNTATGVGTPPPGVPPLPPKDTTITTPIDRAPSIDLLKSFTNADGDGDGAVSEGDVLTYEFSIENTGNVALDNVTLSDPFPFDSPIVCNGGPALPATMQPGDIITCTAPYTVTLADVDAGSLENMATTNGEPPVGLPPVEDSETVNAVLPQNPSLTLAKTVVGDVVADGDILTYTFDVVNDGNVTLTDVDLADALVGISAFTCTDGGGALTLPTTLAAGDSFSCTATYTVTQDDIDGTGQSGIAATVINQATATGTPPGGLPPIDVTDSKTVAGTATPSISLTKSITDPDPALITTAGETLTYEFVIENDGDQTLTAVELTDVFIDLTALACADGAGAVTLPTTMAPGDLITCTVTYDVTQPDVDAGLVANTATATGTPPGSLPPVEDSDDELLIIPQTIGITVDKTLGGNADGDLSGSVTADDVLTYSFEVTNTGNVTLNAVTVLDTKVGLDPAVAISTLTCLPVQADDSLDAGESATCTADYTVTQADVDAGEIENTVTVTGTPPVGVPVTDDDIETVVPARASAITLDKTVASTIDVAPLGVVSFGDTLNYEFLVTNVGSVTVFDIDVTDPIAGVVTCPDTSGGVAPNGTVNCTASYDITQDDVDAGEVVNLATATGTPPPGSPPLPPVEDEETTPVPRDPLLTVTKVRTDTTDPIVVGSTLEYLIVGSNDGNVTLTDVTVSDPLLGTLTCTQPIDLAPGETLRCSGTYDVTQADVDAAQVVNTATGGGTPPPGGPPLPPVVPPTVTTPIPAAPSVAVVKSATPPIAVAVNDTLTYTFDVTNTGNVSLTNITIDDAVLGLVAFPCDPGPLASGDTVSCTYDLTITQPHIDAGEIVNTATTTGQPPTPPGGPQPPPVTSPPSVVTTPMPPDASITIDKQSDAAAALVAGQLITYSFDVENTGNVTLTSVGVADPLAGLSAIDCGGVTSLLPAGTVTCTATYTVLPGDVSAGEITNTATASGQPPTPPGGPVPPPVTDEDTEVVSVQDPSIAVTKSVQGGIPTDVQVDDVLTFEFLVENTGNVELTAVAVTDTLAGVSTPVCEATTLAAGATTTCTATYTVTQDDVDAGEVVNGATANGQPPTPPGGTPPPPVISPPSSVTVPIDPDPSLTVDKDVQGGVPDGIALNDVITYTFLVENTGDVTLTNVGVDDPLVGLSVPVCTSTVLAPGATTTCTATYTITAADVGAGLVTNTATSTGQPPTPPGGPQPPPVSSPPDSVTVPAIAEIGTAKQIIAGPTAKGDGSYDITYEIQVVNGGTVALSDVQIDESLSITFAVASSFSVVSVDSDDLTVNGGFNGVGDTNLLAGTDVLPVGEGGSLTLVVNVTPGSNKGPYLNTAVGSGTPPGGPPVEDPSDSGTFGCNSPCDSTNPDDPHPGEPGDTGGSDDPTPLTFPNGFDLSLVKTLNVAKSSIGVASWDIVIANAGDESALAPITIVDNLPASLTYVSSSGPAGWTCVPTGSTVTCTGTTSMAPGASVTINIVTNIARGATSVVNTASVQSVAGVAVETNTGNNEDSAEAPIGILPATGSNGAVMKLVLRLGSMLLLLGAAMWAATRKRLRSMIPAK